MAAEEFVTAGRGGRETGRLGFVLHRFRREHPAILAEVEKVGRVRAGPIDFAISQVGMAAIGGIRRADCFGHLGWGNDFGRDRIGELGQRHKRPLVRLAEAIDRLFHEVAGVVDLAAAPAEVLVRGANLDDLRQPVGPRIPRPDLVRAALPVTVVLGCPAMGQAALPVPAILGVNPPAIGIGGLVIGRRKGPLPVDLRPGAVGIEELQDRIEIGLCSWSVKAVFGVHASMRDHSYAQQGEAKKGRGSERGGMT